MLLPFKLKHIRYTFHIFVLPANLPDQRTHCSFVEYLVKLGPFKSSFVMQPACLAAISYRILRKLTARNKSFIYVSEEIAEVSYKDTNNHGTKGTLSQ